MWFLWDLTAETQTTPLHCPEQLYLLSIKATHVHKRTSHIMLPLRLPLCNFMNIIFNKFELSEIFSKVFRLKENETGYFFIIAKGHQVWNIWPILVFRNIIVLWKYTNQTYQHRMWLSLLCMRSIRMWRVMQFIDFLTVYVKYVFGTHICVGAACLGQYLGHRTIQQSKFSVFTFPWVLRMELRTLALYNKHFCRHNHLIFPGALVIGKLCDFERTIG